MSAPASLAEWVRALREGGWPGRRIGGEWAGPCPSCGGVDRFHIREGGRAAVLASCRRCGEPFEALARAVFGDRERSDGPGTDGWRDGRYMAPARWREDRREAPPEPRGSPVTAPAASPGPEGGPPDTDARARYAARLWRQSVPIAAAPAHPARRWAARRNLWRPGEAFPPELRWLPARKGRPGAIVALFAPLGAWVEAAPAHPGPAGVQLVTVAPDGSPAVDGGGLGKRSHGRLSGAVLALGEPLGAAGRVHVSEGIADALSIAAREPGAVLATGGTSGLARLADPLARLARPVALWPDGDNPGRDATRQLSTKLRSRGLPVTVARTPDNCDPARLAGPFTGPPWLAPSED